MRAALTLAGWLVVSLSAAALYTVLVFQGIVKFWWLAIPTFALLGLSAYHTTRMDSRPKQLVMAAGIVALTILAVRRLL